MTTHMLTWSRLCPAWMLSLRICFIRLSVFDVKRLHLSVVHLHTNQPLMLASGSVHPETRIHCQHISILEHYLHCQVVRLELVGSGDLGVAGEVDQVLEDGDGEDPGQLVPGAGEGAPVLPGVVTPLQGVQVGVHPVHMPGHGLVLYKEFDWIWMSPLI